jgi:hypothetical protein
MVVISHKHKFIYIKTRKTASSSIQVLLETLCGKDDVITPLNKPTTEKGLLYNKKARNYKGIRSIIKIIKYQIIGLLGIKSVRNIKYFLKSYLILFQKSKARLFFSRYTSHMSVEKLKIKVGEVIWNNYYKFSFERNPWDKVLSSYYHRQPEIPFNEWIKTFSLNLRSQPLNYPLYSIKGKVELDFIGKFENLYEDLTYILKKLNIPLIDLPREKVNFRSNREDYRTFYNDNSKKIINKFYKKEIELMGYSF